MQERFNKWYIEMIEENKKAYSPLPSIVVNDNDFIKKAMWLFWLSQTLQEKTKKEVPLSLLIDYLHILQYSNSTLDKFKKRLINEIEDYCNDLADIPFGYERDIADLWFKINADEMINLIRDFQVPNELLQSHRIPLTLTSTQDYYLAKKTLMRFYQKNDNIPDNIENDIKKILNEKFKFDLNETSWDAFNKLKAEIDWFIKKKQDRDIHLAIERIIHCIHIGSTAKGSTPYGLGFSQSQFDFWGLGDRLVKKSKQDNSGIFKEWHNQVYRGAGNIKIGLDYIQKKSGSILNAKNTTVVLDTIENRVKEYLSKQDNATINISESFLSNITENLNTIKNENEAILNALKSIAYGCRELLKNENTLINNTTSASDKIIELLILQELCVLSKQLTQENDKEKIELIYRSCVDLISLIIILHLEKQDNKNMFIKDNNFIFPKDMNTPKEEQGYSGKTSKILVGKTGQDALDRGLKIVCGNGLYEYEKDTGKKKNKLIPGFNLSTVLSDNGWSNEVEDIAVYWEIGKARGIARKTNLDDAVACVGRISETKFDIDQKNLDTLTSEVLKWCELNKNDQPKTLCVDLTIRKKNDELVSWIKSEKIQKLIQGNKLNILVFQSEQKQQSLGTGKFSAGSVYLLSGNINLITQFNQAAEQSYEHAPDNNLSTFFRRYCTDAMHDVVSQQSLSAEIVASEINNTCLLGYKDECRAIANGPFIIIQFADGFSQNKEIAWSKLKNVWPKSESFGFSKTTMASWDDFTIRVSIGLEPPATLLETLKKMVANPKSLGLLKS